MKQIGTVDGSFGAPTSLSDTGARFVKTTLLMAMHGMRFPMTSHACIPIDGEKMGLDDSLTNIVVPVSLLLSGMEMMTI